MATVWRVREGVLTSVRASPAVVPALLALAALVALAESHGGYYPLDWYPAAAFAFGLLVVALLTVPQAGRVPRAVLVAAALLGAYALWTYLAIAWADDQGAAWDGANTTVLYAIVFALFALWPLRAAPAALLLGAFTLAVTVLGVVELLSVDAAREPGDRFVDGQFAGPVGYTNGNAALWTIAIWPALALGVRREAPLAARPLFLGAAALLAGFALMGQSRGWLFALAPAALLFVVLSRGARARALVAIALAAGATLAISGTLLDVREAIGDTAEFDSAVGDAASALLLTAAVLAAFGLAWALIDRRVEPTARRARAATVAVAAAAVLAGGVGLAVFIARVGSPVTAVSDAWEDFKEDPSPGGEQNRFSGGLGSNRYDFWRVAWGEFRDHPVAGIGADNFQQPYLERGESEERPRHPHSLVLRALSQTGLVGALLLAAALAAALLAAVRGIRSDTGLASLTASAGTSAFLYWLLHGEVDWFWEVPALGCGAFALLGLACSVAPRAARDRDPDREPVPRPLAGSFASRVATLAVAALVGVALVRPWLAELYVERAARGWGEDRERAFGDLDRASDLNPLAASPLLVEGAIASRLGQLGRAEEAFQEALERDPRNAYAMLNVAVIQWQQGRKAEGMANLEATIRLDPRYAVVQEVERAMRKGELLDVNEVNREIARQAARLTGR